MDARKRAYGGARERTAFAASLSNAYDAVALCRLVEIFAQVCSNARKWWDGEVRQRKFPPRHLFVDGDVRRRRLQDHVLRDFGNWIDVRIAARRHPAPDEILVERIGRRAGDKARWVGLGEPIPAAVGRVHFVGENDGPVGVEPELVLGID